MTHRPDYEAKAIEWLDKAEGYAEDQDQEVLVGIGYALMHLASECSRATEAVQELESQIASLKYAVGNLRSD